VPYGKPLAKTREYVEIVRAILRRDKPVEHSGGYYTIPAAGPDATGLGKPLKTIVHPLRSDVPIYLAAIGPKNVALAAEIADGWIPTLYSATRGREAFEPHLKEGFAYAKQSINAVDASQLTGSRKLFGGDHNIVETSFAMTDDLHEHLGQLIAYARMNGVTPPWSK
jgi:alkanesulfonate monooxygenase SsuD/methylene tetrahydromethanopterin reductase-like flavin-dependent oxidoreductase (luciferase family)